MRSDDREQKNRREPVPPTAGRSARLAAARRYCYRLRNHGRAPRGRKYGCGAACEYRGNGRGPGRAHLLVGANQRRALQSCCLARHGDPARAQRARGKCLYRCAGRRMLRGRAPGARHVCVARVAGINPRANWTRSVARGVCRDVRTALRSTRSSSRSESSLAGSRMDRCRLLVHGLDVLRESGNHDRTLAFGHLFRDSAGGCSGLSSRRSYWVL